MVRSRFLRHGSMPPSARYGTDSYSTSSVSRTSRSSSVAPARSTYRASSIAPVRASSVAPRRAASVAPVSSTYSSYRASSVAPLRVSSVRASSVAPIRASSVAPMRASSLAPQSSLSFRSTSVAPSAKVSVIDTSIPTRQFGSRLGYQKVEAKPAIYDEYYGMTYIPSGGRDSWSAYRISDETLDDNDDLVYSSAKKDHEVLKRVNREIAQALSTTAPKYVPVAPITQKFVPRPVPQVLTVKKQVKSMPTYKPLEVIKSGIYRTPAPAVRVTYGTVDDSDELMSKKEKSMGKESYDYDLSRPAAIKALKMRLNDAKTNMDKAKSYMSKYGNADSELSKIDSELQAIKSSRNLRKQHLV